MLRQQLAILLGLALTYSGCSSKVGSSNLAIQSTSASQAVPEDMVITLERGSCFGACPVYELVIFSDGMVVYIGKINVKKLGVVRSHISQEKLKELLSAFEEVNFFSLRDNYGVLERDCIDATGDSPTTNTSLTINGKRKNVSDYSGCSNIVTPKLPKLENRIDEIVSSKQWTN